MTEPSTSPKKKAVVAQTNAPVDLDTIKDDLNIPPTDTTNDAWLQRRIDGIWARMETFCSRKLVSPPQPFIDDWGEITLNGIHINLPPTIAYWPRSTVFLRVFPVAAITAVQVNGSDIGDISGVSWDIDSGKLLALTPQVAPPGWRGDFGYGGDLSRCLLSERARVSYTAGFDELPPDLYEVLLGALQVQWQSRQSQQSGFAGGAVSQVDVMDVGSVHLAGANTFVEAALKGKGGSADPLLGPYAANLTDYIDWRATLGVECFPTTKAGAP